MIVVMAADKQTDGKQQKIVKREYSNDAPRRISRRTEREKKISKGFEWIMQGVNILDQVDNFISDRTKNVIKKLNAAYNEDGSNTHKNFNRNFKGSY